MSVDTRTEDPVPREIASAELVFLAEWMEKQHALSMTEEALRSHVVSVWKKALTGGLHVYRCIQTISFLVPRLPHYATYAKEFPSRRNGRWLEIGCAFGMDVRELRLRGLPRESILAVDVTDGYWKMGMELCGDKESNPPCEFQCADLTLDRAPALQLAGQTTQFDVVFASLVLHVLDRKQVATMLNNVAQTLLADGGIFFGRCVGSAGDAREWPQPDGKPTRFLHSALTLASQLKESFGPGSKIAVVQTDWHQLSDEFSVLRGDSRFRAGENTCLLTFHGSKAASGGTEAAESSEQQPYSFMVVDSR